MNLSNPFLALVLAGAAGGWILPGRAEAASPDATPKRAVVAPVTVSVVERKPVPLELRTFGMVEPVATVAIKSQITGLLTTVLIKEGQEVRKDDPLFVIDSRASEAALKEAEATLAKNLAHLHNAEKEAQRQEELLKQGIAAEDVRDQARTSVEVLKAQIQADRAAVGSAALQVDYCGIQAPIGGRIGSILVHAGNLVKANDTTLVTLNQIQPIRVRFSFPQDTLRMIRERMAEGPLPVQATVPGAVSLVTTGLLTFVDNAVDTSTGTILLKAQFDNANLELWPGLFVSVVLQLGGSTDVLVVPARAILPGQNGPYVYVVGADDTVSNRVVDVLRTQHELAVIGSGLADGERVVTDGQIRLAPGMRVKVQPEPSAAPGTRP
jgi:multidrug efflux system membrane fusion protein